MMRTDLVGGADVLAKVEALQQAWEDARRDLDAAITAVRDAKVADVAAGAAALRAGEKQPTPKEPKAQKSVQDAERHLEIVTLALKAEREAFAAEIASRRDEIMAVLAAAEDEADATILKLADELDDLLHERAEVKAHVIWLEDPSPQVGSFRVAGIEAVAALRSQLGNEPGTASDRQQEKIDRERRVDEWNALVRRATRTHKFVADWPEYRALEVEQAIEAEVERMQAAGETVPVPTNIKWKQKLGMTEHKPKGQGTGWASLPRVEVTPPYSDRDSGEARGLIREQLRAAERVRA
jgi:hypothetical protein